MASKKTKKATPVPALPRAWWRAVPYAARGHYQAIERAQESIALRTPRSYDCYGGYVRHWDTDYPCSGCMRCRPSSVPAWAFGAFVWHLAHAAKHEEVRRGLAGLEGLALIGAAVEAALRPGLAMQDLCAWAIRAYNEVRKGSWFRVVGRMGSAKNYYGVEGEVAWVGEVETDYLGRSTGPARVGLRVKGIEKLAYVAATQIERIPTPADAAEERAAREEVQAMRLARPDHVVSKGARLHVITGKSAGKAGTVFWIGRTKTGRLRYGVDTNPNRPTTKKALKGYRAADSDTCWVDAVDCAPWAFGSAEHIDAEARELAAEREAQAICRRSDRDAVAMLQDGVCS